MQRAAPWCADSPKRACGLDDGRPGRRARPTARRKRAAGRPAGEPWHCLAPACARAGFRCPAIHRRKGRTLSSPVSWSHRCLPGALGEQSRQEWLLAGLCQRVARRLLREAPHQVRRLWQPAAGAPADQTIYDHLAGHHTIGVYPLLPDDSCHFLAVDFDDADWRTDAQAFAQSCRELGVPVALEISRSGNGALRGFSFRRMSPRGMYGGLAPPSSATPAPAPGN